MFTRIKETGNLEEPIRNQSEKKTLNLGKGWAQGDVSRVGVDVTVGCRTLPSGGIFGRP